MKIFVINLDRDVERMAAVRRQLNDLNLDFERVSAVYGKDLTLQERRAAVNRFRWWCAMGRQASDGEVGCALSHFTLYRRMIDENIPVACVLEDDVVVDSRICMVLKKLETVLDPLRSQVALLSNHACFVGGGGNGHAGFRSPPDDCTFELRPTVWDMFTEGYVVTRAGAAALLKVNYPMITPCDAWSRFVAKKAVELYHAFPTTCSQDKENFASSTFVNGLVVKNLPWWRWLLHKLCRCVGVIIDKSISLFEDK